MNNQTRLLVHRDVTTRLKQDKWGGKLNWIFRSPGIPSSGFPRVGFLSKGIPNTGSSKHRSPKRESFARPLKRHLYCWACSKNQVLQRCGEARHTTLK